MWARITSNEIWAKALRIVLVFSLVFWVSFRVECIAFAANISADTDAHENETLTDLKVYQLDVKDGKVEVGALLASMGDTDEKISEPRIGMGADGVQVAAFAAWEQKQEEPKMVEIPDVAGMSGADAADALEAVGLKLSYDTDNPDKVLSGTSPSATQQVEEGATVEAEYPKDEPEESTETNTENEQNNDQNNKETQNNVETSSTVEQVKGVSAPMRTQADSEDEITPYANVTWSVDEEGAKIVDIDVDEKTGVAVLTGKTLGRAAVTCSVSEDEKVEFVVDVVSAPYVGSILLYKAPRTADQSPIGVGEELVLTDSERESYGFWALVEITDETKGDDEEQTKYSIEQGESLKTKSEGQFDDLVWSVRDENGEKVEDSVASITDDGVLTLKGDGPVEVHCTSPNGYNGEEYDQKVVVTSEKAQQDEPQDIQGKSNPQNELTVVIDDPAATASDDASTESGDSESGKEDSDASANAEGSEGETPADGETPAEGETQADDSTSTDKTADAGDESGKPEGTTLKKYTADDDGSLVEVLESGELGEPLGAQTKTYTMNTQTGSTTVEGRGSNLAMLLGNAGVSTEDQKRIKSIEFVSAESGSTTVEWGDLVAVSAGYIMVASKSYVHELNGVKAEEKNAESQGSEESASAENGTSVSTQAEGDDPENTDQTEGENQGGDGETSGNGETSGEGGAGGENAGDGETTDSGAGDGSSTTKLLDNTRFRILYEASSSRIDCMSLQWVNQIIVHMNEPEKKEDITDKELSIYIAYVPVPYGKEAMLSAVPNNKVGSSKFGYTWELSTDDGKTWKEFASDSIQTLRVMTTDPDEGGHIGHQFRVILETDLTNDDGTTRGTTSKPVTIKASDEFSVVLDYTPPIAGDYASFESHLFNTDGVDTSNLTYVWEYNQGNGWDPIPGADQKSSTWRTATTAIDESAASSSSDKDDAIMTYIRVRVIAPGREPIESNVQPLTVRVGESSGGGDKSKEIGEILDGQSGDEGDDGSGSADDDGDDDGDDDTVKPSKSPTIREVGSPVVETSASTMDDEFGESTTDPTVEGNKSEIVINDAVSAKIKEQNDAAKKKAESSTPGMRWTELSTLSPSDEDVQRIFANNPFAPFAIPMGLGVIFAGGLEKLLAFRRQL